MNGKRAKEIRRETRKITKRVDPSGEVMMTDGMARKMYQKVKQTVKRGVHA